MGFHSLPLSDFMPTIGTTRQIENHRQSPQMGSPDFIITQICAPWQQTSSSKNLRDFSLFAQEVLSFDNDGAVSLWPGGDDLVVILDT